MNRHITTFALVAVAATATLGMPWLKLELNLPKPGSQFRLSSAVELDIQLLQGGLSDEVRSHLLEYQVCYTGGARVI